MSIAGESAWAGKKPSKKHGGMAEALCIASDLGFTIPSSEQDEFKPSSGSSYGQGDDLIRILRELTVVQRNIANLQVELQGRKDDKNVAHLTHVSEMEKKCESLDRITSILKDVIQNKDRIIARLQQPYSLDCIPVEAEYQKQFSELLLKAASDYGALTASVSDFQWSQNFREPPSIWGVPHRILQCVPMVWESPLATLDLVLQMSPSSCSCGSVRPLMHSVRPTMDLVHDHVNRWGWWFNARRFNEVCLLPKSLVISLW